MYYSEIHLWKQSLEKVSRSVVYQKDFVPNLDVWQLGSIKRPFVEIFLIMSTSG